MIAAHLKELRGHSCVAAYQLESTFVVLPNIPQAVDELPYPSTGQVI